MTSCTESRIPISCSKCLNMYRILSHSFSTLRIPKEPSLFQDSASSLTKILYELLGKPRRPPSHILSFEAMLHIESPEMLKSKIQSVFPSIHEDYIIHRNLTLMHFSMIAQRFVSFPLEIRRDSRKWEGIQQTLRALWFLYIWEVLRFSWRSGRCPRGWVRSWAGWDDFTEVQGAA